MPPQAAASPVDDLDAVSLSALMSSRLCHDLVNPVGALASGLEVLGDPAMDEGMREAALDLIKSSAEKSVALLKYARLAYGAAGGFGAELPFEEARHVLEALIGWTKATLDWRIVSSQAPKDEVKAVLVLAMAAADCVPRGGVVTVAGDRGAYDISVTGQRVIVQEEMRRVLAGDATELKPKFAPHYLAVLAARRGGGGVGIDQSDAGVSFRLRFIACAGSARPVNGGLTGCGDADPAIPGSAMKTCLIVEDSDVVREIALRILTDLDIDAKEIETAAAAVAACREAKPDIVLLDWDLPSLGALDFLRGVAEFAPDQRPTIVLCATENDPQQFTLAKAAGAAHFLLKPFDRQSIEQKLAEIGVIERAAPAAIKSAQAS